MAKKLFGIILEKLSYELKVNYQDIADGINSFINDEINELASKEISNKNGDRGREKDISVPTVRGWLKSGKEPRNVGNISIKALIIEYFDDLVKVKESNNDIIERIKEYICTLNILPEGQIQYLQKQATLKEVLKAVCNISFDKNFQSSKVISIKSENTNNSIIKISEKNDMETYIAASKDRLLNWKSVNGRLHEILQQKKNCIPIKLRYRSEHIKVLDAISFLNNQENRHGVLIGDGGMGKSTICIKVWEQCLCNNQLAFYMPLNEYNESNGNNIKHYICNYYITNVDYDDKLVPRLIKEMPVVLLLDGFNELNPNFIYSFLQEIKEIREWNNLQIIITSRTSLSDQIYVDEFTELEIDGVEREEIDKYVARFNQHILDAKLYKVLVNPMMLLIYINSLTIMKKSYNIQNVFKLKFIDNPTSNGEVVLNFLNHEILKSEMIGKEGVISYIFIYYVIPYVAYNVELSENPYLFSYKELCKYLNDFASEVLNEYINKFDILLMCKHEIKKMNIYNSDVLEVILHNINNRFSILCKNDNNEFSFTHQIFRDTFSAIHIKNQMILNKKEALERRILPYYLSDILSDILQEHKAQNPKDSKALNCLKIFKGQFDDKSQIAIYNILKLYQKSNCTGFSNFDFSNLDLRKCNLSKYNLNNSNFNESYINRQSLLPSCHTKEITNLFCNPDGKTFITASDDGKVIVWNLETGYAVHILTFSEPNFESDTWAYDQDTPYMKLDIVTSISTNNEGDKIIACGTTSKIKIWDNNTGELLKCLYTGSVIVNSACFNREGDRVLACSENFLYGDDEQKIEIWDYNTCKVIKSKADYRSGTITHACYSLDSKYIFLMKKGSLEIWDKDMIKLQQSIPGDMYMSSIQYWNKITIILDPNLYTKLWYIKTGHVLQFNDGYSYKGNYVNNYSNISFDNKKILKIDYDDKNNCSSISIINMDDLCRGISYEKINEEFKEDTDDKSSIMFKIVEHQHYLIAHAVFCRNSQNIIFVTTDNTIKIWDVDADQEKLSINGLYKLSMNNNICNMRNKGWPDSFSEEPKGKIDDNKCARDSCLSYTVDGREVVIKFNEQITKVCDVYTGKIVETGKEYETSTTRLYSIDGQEIIKVNSTNENYTDDRKIYIYDKNQKSWFSLSGHNAEVMDAVFSPNGKQMVSISSDIILIIWEKNDSKFDIKYKIPIMNIDVKNCNFKNIKTDNITQEDLEQIHRNGGLI